MRRALLLPAVAALLAIAACDNADDDALRVDLNVGASLRYAVTYASDTTGGGSGPLPSVTRVEHVVAVGQTLGALRGLTIVESSETNAVDPTLSALDRTWYRPTDDRLEEVAYEFLGDYAGTFGLKRAAVDPALPRLVRQALARHAAARGDDGGSIVRGPQTRTPARIVIEYPAETGRTWTHFDSDGFRSTREVIGTETVQTPAGAFRCAVVRTRLSFALPEGSIDWVDWIGSVGLVQRRIVYRDQEALDEAGTSLGLVTTTQIERLTERLVAAD